MVVGDTIAAIATAPGRGGVAVIRVSGPDALSVAEKLTGAKDEGRGMRFCRIRDPSSSACIDEAVVLVFRAPRSYTGEDVVEIQCHGGTVTPRRILGACFAAGARLAHRGEFTERAFLNGRLDYDQAASVLDLVDAKTVRAADAALEGLAGRRRRERRALYEAALDLSARFEHALDIDEGELPDGFVEGLREKCGELRASIAKAIARANEGRLLREGALVVLAGPPNAGKSSLMNALLEENRAIVSATPGTTRDSIEEWMDLDGWPIRLVDTAGLRATADAVEAEGVRRAEDLMARADVVLWLRGHGGEGSRGSEASQPPNLPASKLLGIHAKCDLDRGEGLNVSVRTGEGLDELKRAIVSRLEAKAENVAAAEPSPTESSALRETLALLDAAFADPLRMAPNGAFDLVLTGNAVRCVAERLGVSIGAIYSEDLLVNLFSRFCVGK